MIWKQYTYICTSNQRRTHAHECTSARTHASTHTQTHNNTFKGKTTDLREKRQIPYLDFLMDNQGGINIQKALFHNLRLITKLKKK